MVEVIKYNEQHKDSWDAFVKASKNATFLLLRDYMEYHASRFTDHSLLFFRKGKLIALMPANEQREELHSHSGLTYGGILSDKRMKANIMLDVFEAMKLYLQEQGFKKLKYKTIPHIYHRAPAEEDLFALFRNKALLTRRDVLSVIEPEWALDYSRKRKWGVARAGAKKWVLGRSQNFEHFMYLLADLLQRKYNAAPVHTLQEIQLLAERFPENIKLFTASEEAGEIAAGVLIYETDRVAHCQYIGYTEGGRINGALGVLINYLLKEVYHKKAFFDLGASMEQQGQQLNNKLLANKESYGARTVVHDYYVLNL